MGDEATQVIGWSPPVSEPPPAPAPAGAGEPTPPPANWVVGRFRVVRELGRGGMGVVLLAHDRDLDRPVAVKLLKDDHPDVLARFRLEAHALAGLTHPNAVRVYEFGEHAGRPFLALEYVAGHSLHDALRAGPLDPNRTAGLLAQVAEAVQAAHELGIVHRDLKPANVLLDGADVPKLTDFGIARRLDDGAGLTKTNVAVGTPGYMAPEQAEGQPPDARTDVYGLGATLYECLTGRPPFVGPTAAVLAQVVAADPVPPRALNAGVPADLETVCLKCLHKDPARRYPTAAALAADLNRVARGEPVRARPTSRAEKAARWARRNKLPAALAASVVLSLAGGATAAGWQAVRATTARDAEAQQRTVAEAKTAEAEVARADAQTAEAAARADKRLAEQRADETATINKFLLDDLIKQASAEAQVSASYAPNPKLTVREALDRAAGRVGERFAGRPHLAEFVRMALGEAYDGLGEHATAAGQYELALDSRKGRLPPADPDRLAATVRLAQAYKRAGRPAEAVPLLTEALRVYREAFGPDHADTLVTLGNLALAVNDAGAGAEAMPLHEEVVRLMRAHHGPAHLETAAVEANLAGMYLNAGRPADAQPLIENALRVMRAGLGASHPRTLTLLNNLATAHKSAGRHADALAVNEECLKLRRECLGPDHPDTLVSLGNVAAAYDRAGRAAEALPLKADVLRLRRAKLGADHPHTLLALDALAFSYVKAGRTDEAVPLLEEQLRLSRGKLGPTHDRTLRTMSVLAVVHGRAGRHDLALPLHEEGLRIDRDKLGPTDPQTLASTVNVAVTLNDLRRWADALPLYEAVWRARSAQTPPHPQAEELRWDMGRCLMRSGRFADAEGHLLAYHAYQAAKPDSPVWERKARERLADLYDQWGKPAEAARWRPAVAPMPRPAP